MKKLFNTLDKIEEYFVAGSLLVMLSIAFANVLSRKIFKASWSFTEEITANLFILASMLGAAIAARRGSHLGLSLVTDMFPKKAQKYLVLITTILSVIFCVVLVKEGFVIMRQEMVTGQLTAALGWPEWIFGSFIPIGGIFLLIRFVQSGIERFKEEEVE